MRGRNTLEGQGSKAWQERRKRLPEDAPMIVGESRRLGENTGESCPFRPRGERTEPDPLRQLPMRINRDRLGWRPSRCWRGRTVRNAGNGGRVAVSANGVEKRGEKLAGGEPLPANPFINGNRSTIGTDLNPVQAGICEAPGDSLRCAKGEATAEKKSDESQWLGWMPPTRFRCSRSQETKVPLGDQSSPRLPPSAFGRWPSSRSLCRSASSASHP